MKRAISTFTVTPSLPPELGRLRELAYNLRWSWDHEAIALFRRLDPDLWETTGHNPVLMLGTIEQEKLKEGAADDAFLAHLERSCSSLDEYMQNRKTWYNKNSPSRKGLRIAYFSAEFGLADCMPIYAGGLGVLAGDQLKTASDLGLPAVGVGLLYQEGYFHQYLTRDGWQGELYPLNDFYNMPVRLQLRNDGEPVTVDVACPGRSVKVQVWCAQVGRVPLFLLDTNIPPNTPEDQRITERLYVADLEARIRQEIVLGIGGLRALGAMGLRPTDCHLNEGHSAFGLLERIRMMMVEGGLSFTEAREAASSGTIFTTHTPVRAGIDLFPPELMDKYFADYYPLLSLSREEFLGLGRQNPADPGEPFSPTVLALRLAGYSNGVSSLNGVVSRRMWQSLWPGVPEEEVPITSVTNGIHPLSWVSPDMILILDRYLGPRWREDPAEQSLWNEVNDIPDEELWRAHERRRERLIAITRQRLREQLERRGVPSYELTFAGEVLDPAALTIGFARRFATYKRPTLVLHDAERLARLLTDPQRPVQIIFAGKAHPQDNPGKELIREIIRFARREDVRRRIVFVEDLDLALERYLVQGVDVWLNNPRRPLEACGTSGMKAAVNGALNISVLDGWWDEAYRSEVGWAIGSGEEYQDTAYQDEVESQTIYDLLGKEVIPLFYQRGTDRLPRGWIARMKASMRSLAPVYSSFRMVREYCQRFYLPAAARYELLAKDGMERAKTLARWKANLHQLWPGIGIAKVEASTPQQVEVGSRLEVQAEVHLGGLSPDDVSVELYHGPADVNGNILRGETVAMTCAQGIDQGKCLFVGAVDCRTSGLYGYTVRVLPRHNDLNNNLEPGLILWAE